MGMLLGSEDFLVLPSSWLVTLYSCLEEGQLQIISLKYCLFALQQLGQHNEFVLR